MNLEEAKAHLEAVEGSLDAHPFVVACSFARDGRGLDLAVTARLRKLCRRGRVWKSKAFLTAFKNGAYGFDPLHAQSPGGADGIFVVSREYRPANEMMRKLFDRFLDRDDRGAHELLLAMGVGKDEVWPVRLVSHHLRLLGLLRHGPERDLLVLIDYDATKEP